MDYAESLAWLYGLPKFGGGGRDVSRVRRLLAAAGDPQKRFPAVHVTGTNGKGSVSATLAAILQATGARTGLYTSPHLTRFNERFRVDGEDASDADVARLATAARALVERLAADEPGLAFAGFDVFTLMAFAWFAERGVDVAVVEVGMGGRLDATNVFDAPLGKPAGCGGTTPVVVLTNVGLEHVDVLGATREAIAREKLALAKEGSTLVTAETDEGVLEEARRRAADVGAKLVHAGRDVAATLERAALDGTTFAYAGARWRMRGLRTPLLGAHQIGNMAAALAAVEELDRRGVVRVTERAVRDGLAATRWPARLEIVARDPLVIVDAAHNPHGVDAVVRSVAPHVRGASVTLVLGVSETKPYREMIPKLAGLADRIVVTRAEQHGLEPKAVLDVLVEAGFDVARVPVDAHVADAVRRAIELTPQGGVVLVLGGLFLAAEAREALRPR